MWPIVPSCISVSSNKTQHHAVMNDLTMNIEHGNDQGNYDRERWKKEREDAAMAEFKKTEQCSRTW